MDPADPDAVRAHLHERREVLHAQVSGMAAPPERGSGISFGKRIGDGTIEAVQRLTDVGVGTSLETTLERVDRALAKLDEGTYGRCDACGQPIAPKRLAARPESVLCIECARRAR